MTRPRLSVIVITKNEAEFIEQALESVKWADEIVIVDSGSTDDTLNICRRYTSKIVVHADWQGFGIQKNRALNLASGDWILSIDADEQVSPELAQEIQSTLETANHPVFSVPRLSSFMGRPIRHGDWWPDEIPRLFRRGQARFSDDLVHEKLIYEGRPLRLRHLLFHKSIRSIEQLLEKTNSYTTAGARRLRDSSKNASIGTAIGHALWAFIRGYVLKRGFMDGKEGFIIAISVAENSFYKYIKLGYLRSMK